MARGTAGLAAALVVASGCSSSPQQPAGIDASSSPNCLPAVTPMPRANIGPDVDLRVVCGETASAAVASVDEMSAGGTIWTVSLAGDPQFGAPRNQFVTCQVDGPTVAFVSFEAPPSALPGDAFSTVVTIHAEHGEFPDGTVHVRAEIVPASATTATPTIDFGDVPVSMRALRDLSFLLTDASNLQMNPAVGAPFDVAPATGMRIASRTIRPWQAAFTSYVPGDYTGMATWTVIPATMQTPTSAACTSQVTVTLHARAVAADASADAGDGTPDDGGPPASADAGVNAS
jgi:hypothetical protein